jgi:hypothetical protein
MRPNKHAHIAKATSLGLLGWVYILRTSTNTFTRPRHAWISLASLVSRREIWATSYGLIRKSHFCLARRGRRAGVLIPGMSFDLHERVPWIDTRRARRVTHIAGAENEKVRATPAKRTRFSTSRIAISFEGAAGDFHCNEARPGAKRGALFISNVCEFTQAVANLEYHTSIVRIWKEINSTGRRPHHLLLFIVPASNKFELSSSGGRQERCRSQLPAKRRGNSDEACKRWKIMARELKENLFLLPQWNIRFRKTFSALNLEVEVFCLNKFNKNAAWSWRYIC